MMARIHNYTWTDKPSLSRHAAFTCIILMLALIAFFKMRPYFTDKPKIVVLRKYAPNAQTPHEAARFVKNNNVTKQSSTGKEISILGLLSKRSVPRHYQETLGARHVDGDRIIERPLFDNVTVMLAANLLHAYSSAQNDNSVEAEVLSVTDDKNLADGTALMTVGASLIGTASPNFELKRVNLQFSELITKDGRRYPVSAVAIDPETNMIGVPGDYSSGMISRLVGAGLGRAIGVTDGLVRSRIIENSQDHDAISRELSRNAADSGSQAVDDLGQEATKGLREARAEIRLSAGMSLTIRLKAGSRGGTR